MNRYITLLFASCVAMSAMGQYKLNATGRNAVARYQMQQADAQIKSTDANAPLIGAIVALEADADISALEEAGFTVSTDLGDMALLSVPIDRLEELAALGAVHHVSAGGRKHLKLANGHASTGVSALHAGIDANGSTTQFTGSGVIVGMMDTGLDPNHPFFRRADGTSRVERLWNFTGYYGSSSEYDAESVSTFQTDDSDESHATHVAGIMGGRYYGTATYVTADAATGDNRTQQTGTLPHVGVAPDAALALGCGDLYDNNILAAVGCVLDYAQSTGRPAAVNLSLGSNSGPHDGTDDFSQALDRLGQKGIICVAAGNEGDMDMSIERTFTSSDTQFSTLLYYMSGYVSSIDGVLDIWSSDDRTLHVTVQAVNKSGVKSTIIDCDNVKSTSYVGSSSKFISSGSLSISVGKDAANNRYNVNIDCSSVRMASGYRLGLTISGAEGQKANVYFEGYSAFTDSYNGPGGTPLTGFVAGTPDQSINGMGCGYNVVTVGAYTSAANWGDFSGSWSYEEKQDDYTSFSSYGSTPDGRRLPEISAPGSVIVSSYSRYYVAKGYTYDSAEDMVASAKDGSNTQYWGAMQGTSMATPYVTGVVALMLQADPSLNIDDVHSILAATATTDSYTQASPERFGAGKVNALEAVRETLRRKAGIGSVAADADMAVSVIRHSGSIDISATDGTSPIEAALFTTAGMEVARRNAPAGSVTLSTESLTPGVYILTAVTSAGRTTRKITIR
ncbi:MAG: S8 family peptidase [Muribaculaceae bacterium]|nr:S8 family peptidase [Muribaculaceae bacterium]